MTSQTEQNISLAELQHAKDQLARQYIENMKALENSKNPLETLKELSNDQANITVDQSIKTYPVYTGDKFENQQDAIDAERALAEKELYEHHRDEYETLQATHLADLQTLEYQYNQAMLSDDKYEIELMKCEKSHEEDSKALSLLHSFERNAFEKSDSSLSDVRAVTKDHERYDNFEEYVQQRLEEAKQLNLEETDKSISVEHSLSHSESFIQNHLNQESIQQANDNAPIPPFTYDDHFAREDWPPKIFVEEPAPSYKIQTEVQYNDLDKPTISQNKDNENEEKFAQQNTDDLYFKEGLEEYIEWNTHEHDLDMLSKDGGLEK